MSQWDEIHKTSTLALNTFTKMWDVKLKNDASVIVGDKWSDVVTNASKLKEEATNHLEVAPDERTGALTTQVNLPLDHPDYFYNNKPLSKYVLDKYKANTDQVLDGIKNPYAKKELQNRITNHRAALSHHLLSFESKVVMDKRYSMAVDNIEKSSVATYNEPSLYETHLQDNLVAIDSLAIDPLNKRKLVKKALSSNSTALANNLFDNDPSQLLQESGQWEAGLSSQKVINIKQQAQRKIEQQHKLKLTEFNSNLKRNFNSILETGESIDGIEAQAEALGLGDELRRKEGMYLDSHEQLQIIKQTDINSQLQNLGTFKPTDFNDPDYEIKSKIYSDLHEKVSKLNKIARTDPAQYVDRIHYEERINKDREGTEIYIDRIAQQEKAGIPRYKQRYLTNAERDNFISSVNSKDPEEIRRTLDTLSLIEYKNTNLGYDIINELMNSNKIDSLNYAYVNAFLNNDEPLQRDIANAIATKQHMAELLGADSNKYDSYIKDELKPWRSSMLKAQPHNSAEVNTIVDAVKKFSVYYAQNRGVDIKPAVDLAIDNIINKNYHKLNFNKFSQGPLYLPTKINELDDDGDIIKLDEKYLDNGLRRARSNLINEYNSLINLQVTFGTERNPEEYLEQKYMEDIMRSGLTTRLSQDKKSIYYTYVDKQGESRPLLASKEVRFTIDLKDLHNYELVDYNQPANDIDVYSHMRGF